MTIGIKGIIETCGTDWLSVPHFIIFKHESYQVHNRRTFIFTYQPFVGAKKAQYPFLHCRRLGKARGCLRR